MANGLGSRGAARGGGGGGGGGGYAFPPPPPPREPRIEILELDNERIKFVLSNSDLSMANALRRTMIAEVPTVAIHWVELKQNSSVLFDEMIVHRLGLLPIVSHAVDSLKYEHECVCDGHCPECSVEYTLSVLNRGDEPVTVSSRDLRPPEGTPFVPVHAAADDKIPLVKLGKHQELTLTARARKGIGKEHAKWSPVAVATYQQDPRIVLNNAVMEGLAEAKKREFVASCPTEVYAYNAGSETVQVARPTNCMLCNECVKRAEAMGCPDLVSVSTHPGRFIFSVESSGALRPESIVLTALEVLTDKLRRVEEEVERIKHAESARDGALVS